MKLWTLKKFTTGKSDKVELDRCLLGFYRVVWTRTNSFPTPPCERLYLFTRKRAERMFSNISHWVARVSVWHEAPPQDDIDENRWKERDGEDLRDNITRWLQRHEIVSLYLDTPHHRVDIQCAKLPPRIKNVLSRWGAIYIKDEQP